MNTYKFKSLIRHLWLDASDAQRAIAPDVLRRLTQYVSASERRHTGQIRICIEASLPMSYLWRLGSKVTIRELVRQRAMMLFGKLRLWDTEHNNGVLVYLQLAERSIEIVADRGLDRHVSAAEWEAMTHRMAAAFKDGRFEDGLAEALGEVSALLVLHFPAAEDADHADELPNEPVIG